MITCAVTGASVYACCIFALQPHAACYSRMLHAARCVSHVALYAACCEPLVAMLYCAPCLPERFARTRRYDGVPVVSFGTLREMLPRTLTVNGFSKCYAMTG